ncbi:hypothetical protein KIH79_04385 [Bifidobacterium sp. 82T10]|uniref:Uncharacterized protein n=1 Tax=Bifidobacterium miconis TaxID=2834435 RepID=A0ABS6WEB2_9BIFI|nr:hypothetical protein [Bifidobacterium miconis]MBW3092202.1 hypothetical protein [Bifidobacterium miconis]
MNPTAMRNGRRYIILPSVTGGNDEPLRDGPRRNDPQHDRLQRDDARRNESNARGTVSETGSGASAGRPMWWWLLAAFLAFAVIVTGAFVWQRATRVTAQKIYDELVSLEPNATKDQLTARGYAYGGRAAYGWRTVDDDEFPTYDGPDEAPIDAFMNDVRAGRESVLRLVVDGIGPSRKTGTDEVSDGTSVRILWFDPTADADWADKDDPRQPASIHHDGKGQIREWWWRDGEVVVSDKRFSRAMQRDDEYADRTYVLKHQPAIPSDPDSTSTVIVAYDENLYSRGSGLGSVSGSGTGSD